MIKSAQILNGFAINLPAFNSGRIFEFNDKYNVVFANNGTGKSVLIKTLAAYCGIKNGGWTSISEPAQLAYNDIKHFPYCYKAYAPGLIDAKVEWDGVPSFYYDAEMLGKNDMTWFWSSEKASLDGITSEAEQLDILATKPSSGQYRIHKINKIMRIIQYPPDLTQIPPNIVNKELAQLEVNYIQSLPRNGRITLLFDEPEKALSLPRQLELFNVLNELSNHFQVIIVTHSPFILYQKGINVIDLETKPLYSKVCKDLIKKHMK